MTTPIFIDSDNAMGARMGDVDDGFALAALLLSGLPIAALSSVAGNTSERQAASDNRAIARVCRTSPLLLRGEVRNRKRSEAAQFLIDSREPVRVVALGPLTNVAAALSEIGQDQAGGKFEEVVIVGTDSTSRGKWPPLWPHEFNLTYDGAAFRLLFESEVPLLIVPLDVCGTLRISRSDLDDVDGVLGEYLRENSRRWFRRCQILKWSGTVRLFDLVAAMVVIGSPGVAIESTSAAMNAFGHVQFGVGRRPVRVVRRFDSTAMWQSFLTIVNSGSRQ
ncbi:MAG: nucleoside hydrolase [Acidobacteriota bacterium]